MKGTRRILATAFLTNALFISVIWIQHAQNHNYIVSALLIITYVALTSAVLLRNQDPEDKNTYYIYPSILFIFLTIKYYITLRKQTYDINITLDVCELLLLAIGLFVTHKLTHNISRLENIVTNIYIDDNKVIDNNNSNVPAIDTLLMYSRRHERPFSIIFIEADIERLTDNYDYINKIADEIKYKLADTKISKLLLTTLRKTDILVKGDKPGIFYVVCPEADNTKAIFLADRISEYASHELSIELKHASVSFPTDGFTYEGLIQKAKNKFSM
jgi:hypothetical protein